VTIGRSIAALLTGLCLAGCGPGAAPPIEVPATPLRVVSLDYCADQYVLKFVPKARIAGISPDAHRAFSYMRDAAVGLPQVRSRAEDVLLAAPDLVVRSYGGGPNASAFFERAGVPVLQIGSANSLPEVLSLVQDTAAQLGAATAGAQLVQGLQARLDRLTQTKNTDPSAPRVLYMTPGGVTSGPGSLVHELIVSAGLRNYSERRGWQPLPLERLAFDAPERVAAGFFQAQSDHRGDWSATRHPIAQRQLRDQPVVELPGAWTACGAWFLLDAVEALAQQRAL
jgi:iron complex transport system substrate-binding protein